MRFVPLLLMGILAGCSRPAYVAAPSAPPPLDANGLPPHFSLCVRNAAEKSAAVYNVFYGCQREITSYVAALNGPTQQDKARMAEEMAAKGNSYAQEVVIARHGVSAMKRTLDTTAPPPVSQASTQPSSLLNAEEKAQVRRWADCTISEITAGLQLEIADSAVMERARISCDHMWAGTPMAADRIRAKILASVRAGVQPVGTNGPVIVDREQMPPAEQRF